FQAVEVVEAVKSADHSIASGVWFRLMLGGITGHKDLARATNIIVKPEDATKVADAVVRVFIREGDRTNRAKARLKYLLDDWGVERFGAGVEKVLGRGLTRCDASFLAPRPKQDRQAHIGVHRQKQAGLHYIGVVLPLGKMMATQMREIASIARDLGDG